MNSEKEVLAQDESQMLVVDKAGIKRKTLINPLSCECNLDWSVTSIPDQNGDPCAEIAVNFDGLDNCNCNVKNVNFHARKTNYTNTSTNSLEFVSSVAVDENGNPISTVNTNVSPPFKVLQQSYTTITSNNLIYIDEYDIVIAGDPKNQYVEVCITVNTDCEEDCSTIRDCIYLLTPCT